MTNIGGPVTDKTRSVLTTFLAGSGPGVFKVKEDLAIEFTVNGGNDTHQVTIPRGASVKIFQSDGSMEHMTRHIARKVLATFYLEGCIVNLRGGDNKPIVVIVKPQGTNVDFGSLVVAVERKSSTTEDPRHPWR